MTEEQIIIYQTPNGNAAIDVKVIGDTIWLTLNQIAELFDKNKSTISRHINNIYKEEELKQGTQFRIWANSVLKDYLVKGYAINEKRLKEQEKQLNELKSTVKLLSNVLTTKELNSDEAIKTQTKLQ